MSTTTVVYRISVTPTQTALAAAVSIPGLGVARVYYGLMRAKVQDDY